MNGALGRWPPLAIQRQRFRRLRPELPPSATPGPRQPGGWSPEPAAREAHELTWSDRKSWSLVTGHWPLVTGHRQKRSNALSKLVYATTGVAYTYVFRATTTDKECALVAPVCGHGGVDKGHGMMDAFAQVAKPLPESLFASPSSQPALPLTRPMSHPMSTHPMSTHPRSTHLCPPIRPSMSTHPPIYVHPPMSTHAHPVHADFALARQASPYACAFS